MESGVCQLFEYRSAYHSWLLSNRGALRLKLPQRVSTLIRCSRPIIAARESDDPCAPRAGAATALITNTRHIDEHFMMP